MNARIEYKKYEKLGPYNIKYIEDTRKVNAARKANFICPYCNKIFEANISDIKNGKQRSCGCTHKGITNNPRFQDITGNKYGHLTVLHLAKNPHLNSTHIKWTCLCDCGNIVDKQGCLLKNGKTTTCGSKECQYFHELKAKNRKKNIAGKKFGKLTALYNTDKLTKHKEFIWHCRCDCGKELDVPLSRLTSGNTKSCGCTLSFYEEHISNLLEKTEYRFERQKSFDSCINPKTSRKLRFDFYIPSKRLLIEYNGSQHYYSGTNQGWNTPEENKKLKYRDNIKKEWCKKNNYNLHIIPYTESSKIDNNYIQNILSQYNEVDEEW